MAKGVRKNYKRADVQKWDGGEPKFAYVLMVEWDGKQPPMSWYNRLHEYGLRVRGSKEESPLARRFHHTAQGWGVIAQEGLILVETESLLEQLTVWAEKYGASNVLQGRMVIEKRAVSPADDAALATMVKAITKPGPKLASQVGHYVITCLDEVRTFERDMDELPTVCPDCLSHRIVARRGDRNTFLSYKYAPDDWSVYDYWRATRFEHGMFEIPNVVAEHKQGNEIPHAPDDRVAPVALPEYKLNVPQKVSDNPEFLLHIYDIAYVLSRWSKERRLEGRLRVLDAYYLSGGESTYLMAVKPVLDIVDFCVLDNSLTKYL